MANCERKAGLLAASRAGDGAGAHDSRRSPSGDRQQTSRDAAVIGAANGGAGALGAGRGYASFADFDDDDRDEGFTPGVPPAAGAAPDTTKGIWEQGEGQNV